MMILRQSTASQAVLIGPFLDSTDGVTAETSLTINAADVRLSKNGANIVGKNSGGGTHDENGWYTITLDATDTNTVGRLQLHVAAAGALPVWLECHVLEEAIYDALFGASATGFDANGRVDVGSFGGTTVTARDIGASVLLSPGTGTGQVSLSSGAVTVATNNDKTGYSLANLTVQASTILATGTHNPQTGDAFARLGAAGAGLTGVPWNAAWDAEVESEVTDALNAYDPPTNTEMVAAFTEIKGATWSSVTDTLEAIRDRGDAAWVTATGFSTLDAAGVRAAVGLASANLDAQLADLPTVAEFEARTLAAASYFDPATDTVTVATNNDKTGYTLTPTTGLGNQTANITGNLSGSVGSVTGSVGSVTGNVGGNVAGSVGSVAAGGITASSIAAGAIAADAMAADAIDAIQAGLSTLDAAGVRTAVGLASANLDSQLAAIVADTNELQTDWADGGRLDVILAARSTLDAAAVNAQVLDVLNVDTLVAGVTISEALRRIGAIASGRISGAGTDTETFLDYALSGNSIVITADASGNRTNVAYN